MSASVHPPSPSRRRALAAFVNGVVTAVGGGLAALLGAFVVRPPSALDRERWLRAGKLTDLVPGTPVARILSIRAEDGWYRARTRETVFLLWDGTRSVRAFSATCTHLGCQVHWDLDGRRFLCPCHGGAYDVDGRVIAGPPPRPLVTRSTRVDEATQDVLVRL
jgi:Rieske Fe-S protein